MEKKSKDLNKKYEPNKCNQYFQCCGTYERLLMGYC